MKKYVMWFLLIVVGLGFAVVLTMMYCTPVGAQSDHRTGKYERWLEGHYGDQNTEREAVQETYWTAEALQTWSEFWHMKKMRIGNSTVGKLRAPRPWLPSGPTGDEPRRMSRLRAVQ